MADLLEDAYTRSHMADARRKLYEERSTRESWTELMMQGVFAAACRNGGVSLLPGDGID